MDCGDGVKIEMLLAQEEQTVMRIVYENFRLLVVQGEIPETFRNQLDPAAVVYLNQAEFAMDWLPVEPGLVIVPEVIPELKSLDFVVGLNMVNGLEIMTDGESLSLFQR